MVRILKDSFLQYAKASRKNGSLIFVLRYFGLRKTYVIKDQATAFSLHQILLG